MSREELKNKVEKYCGNNLKLRLMCGGLFCQDCPLYIKNNDEERCARGDDEVKEVLEEVWAESHGYVKKEDLRPKINVEDTEKDVNDLTYTPSKPNKYTDNDGKLIPQELSSISCVVKIKDKWDYLKDTLKVIYEQETCISKKDAYKKVIKIMEEYEA